MKSWYPFSPRNWKRKNFDSFPSERRLVAEAETDHDLQKSPQQLLCDAHEEALITNRYFEKIRKKEEITQEDYLICFNALLGVQKRIASLQMRNALNSGKVAWIAIGIAALSLAMSIYGLVSSKNDQSTVEPENYNQAQADLNEGRKGQKELNHLAPPAHQKNGE